MKRIKFSPTLGHLTNFCTSFYEFFNFGKFVKIRKFFCWGNGFSIYELMCFLRPKIYACAQLLLGWL